MAESMINRIKDKRKFLTSVSNYSVDSWFSFIDTSRLNLDAYYQREYVWENKHQQEFLNNILSGFPLGGISVAKTLNPQTGRVLYEVVDGKQRITTLKLFFRDEIAIIIDGKPVKYSELTMPEQNAFSSVPLPMIILENATEKEKLEYFYEINFSGVPQSEEHKNKIVALINTK